MMAIRDQSRSNENANSREVEPQARSRGPADPSFGREWEPFFNPARVDTERFVGLSEAAALALAEYEEVPLVRVLHEMDGSDLVFISARLTLIIRAGRVIDAGFH